VRLGSVGEGAAGQDEGEFGGCCFEGVDAVDYCGGGRRVLVNVF